MAWIDRARIAAAPVVHDVVADLDVDELPPGSSDLARLIVLDPDLWPDLQPGDRFDLLINPSIEGNWAEVVQPLADSEPGDIGAR